MTTDPFKPVRDHLAIATTCLELSKPRTDPLLDSIRAVERQMDWRGDPYAAHYTLRGIISDLNDMTTPLPDIASGTTKSTQNIEPVLLPGVADAIGQLESAVTLLKTL
jgi:hypothetical protein